MISNSYDVKTFIKSTIAQDMRRELMKWKKDLRELYYDAETMLEKGRIDGRIEAVNYALGLPEAMLTAALEAEEQRQEEQNEIKEEG